MKKKFKIKGIDCANCAAHLEEKIKKVEGVESASISFFTENMVIECSEENLGEVMKNIQKIIKREEPDAIIEEI